MDATGDPDLPGDETFRPTGLEAAHILEHPSGGGPAWAIAMTISPEGQAAQHHNRLRYLELEKARRGEANRYAQTRYRT